MRDAINIDSLLKSDTYQNMSDEEIQALIDYKAHERLMQHLLDAQELAVNAANDAFNKAIATASAYKEVN